jgi:hypothetical protein
MDIKRIIVFVVSAVVGLAAPYLLIAYFGTTPEKFAYSNIALVAISVASIVGIWLDFFLDTKILKS